MPKTRESTCQFKKAYDRKDTADKALVSIQRRGKDTNPARPLHVYRCQVCKKYHLGRRPATVLDYDEDF
jgi:hypothetical protein